ncbi:hypothetical protein D3C75_864740 [compost metagenome]
MIQQIINKQCQPFNLGAALNMGCTFNIFIENVILSRVSIDQLGKQRAINIRLMQSVNGGNLLWMIYFKHILRFSTDFKVIYLPIGRSIQPVFHFGVLLDKPFFD